MKSAIAAVSTPLGNGGIGIVRVSGSDAFEIAGRLFFGKKPFSEIRSHTISYGRIVDPFSGHTVDEVLLSKMKGPHTFTKEDMVEINCHGGTTVLRNVLELVIRLGARPAEAGEFTKRAFLNGRIDLSQAEAVIDLINSKTAEGARAAVSQLEGKLSAKIRTIRKKLIELIAHIEVTVDYPEHDIEEITGSRVYDEVNILKDELHDLAQSFDKGRIIREGIIAVIAGKTNVGKSSLLNSLSGSSRAIVTNIPGTTRDIIEEYINIRGIPVRLTDTAGIRQTSDPVESIGVEKAEKSIESADVVIMVLDASTGIEPEDEAIIRKLKGKRTLFLVNKIDLVGEAEIEELLKRLGSAAVMSIRVSLLNGSGIDKVESTLEEMFMSGGISLNNEVLVTNARHKSLIDSAMASLETASVAHESGMPLDFVTIDIKEAAESLGRITGESVSEDVVHEIFSRFCVGK
jgi:tRNA modification GTPase